MTKIIMPRPLDRVVILGMGNSLGTWIHSQYADPFDFDNPRQEVIGINSAIFPLRVSKCIWIDDHQKDQEATGFVEKFGKFKVPVITSRAYPEYENTWEFPLQHCFDHWNDTYLRNSIAFAVAWALMCFYPKMHQYKSIVDKARYARNENRKAPKRIELFGADFNYKGSNCWEKGRGCVEWWLSRAKDYGVSITLPPSTLLLDMQTIAQGEVFYGYHEQPELEQENGYWKIVKRECPDPPDEGNVLVLASPLKNSVMDQLLRDSPQ